MDDLSLINKFQEIENHFLETQRQISDPEVIADLKKYQGLLKKHKQLEEGIEIFRVFKKQKDNLTQAEDMLKDPELKEMAAEEVDQLNKKIEETRQSLQCYLIPPHPDDEKNAIIEIRSGTGGEEAALFASDLYRMYIRYAENQGWKIESMSETLTGLGGIKDIAFLITGSGVFRKLKFESGTHRVQRVPKTESQGRVHTSAVTVAILPEADEVDVQLEMKDIRVDTYRASGAGGQHVNKTSSAIRLTHLPTGVVVACQDERSQFQNKDKAMRLLKARLYELEVEKSSQSQREDRKLQVGSGDRSEKIRTYNFPQSRVTDHRINLTLYTLEQIINGDLNDLIAQLLTADQLEKLKLLQ